MKMRWRGEKRVRLKAVLFVQMITPNPKKRLEAYRAPDGSGFAIL